MRELQLQEDCLSSCNAHVSIHARNAQLDLSRADLAAMYHLTDAFAAWRAEAQNLENQGGGIAGAGVPAMQIAIELDASVRCNLQTTPQVRSLNKDIKSVIGIVSQLFSHVNRQTSSAMHISAAWPESDMLQSRVPECRSAFAALFGIPLGI